MRRITQKRFLPFLLLSCSFLLLGSECQENPDESPITEIDRSHIAPIDADEICLENGTCEAWASSLWMNEMTELTDLDLEGYIEIAPNSRIILLHNLGRAPREVIAYVGFSEASEMLMPASGNAAEIWEVTAEHIIIRNGSGGSFFYRFVLR